MSCKPMVDIKSGHCRGDGFVRFANEEGFKTARRELTQRGYYVSVAHETATMKHLVTMERPQHASHAVAPEASDWCDVLRISPADANLANGPLMMLVPLPIFSAFCFLSFSHLLTWMNIDW